MVGPPSTSQMDRTPRCSKAADAEVNAPAEIGGVSTPVGAPAEEVLARGQKKALGGTVTALVTDQLRPSGLPPGEEGGCIGSSGRFPRDAVWSVYGADTSSGQNLRGSCDRRVGSAPINTISFTPYHLVPANLGRRVIYFASGHGADDKPRNIVARSALGACRRVAHQARAVGPSGCAAFKAAKLRRR